MEENQEMKEAQERMLKEFDKMFEELSPEQKTGVVALATLIDKYAMSAGYRNFCRELRRKLREGELTK